MVNKDSDKSSCSICGEDILNITFSIELKTTCVKHVTQQQTISNKKTIKNICIVCFTTLKIDLQESINKLQNTG